MAGKRRAGPAAIAAALIGASLLLYRPRLVPELRAGPRAAPPAPRAELASAISWTPAAATASASAGHTTVASGPRASEEATAWRDALVERPYSASMRAPTAPIAAILSRHERELRESPSSAETDPVHSSDSRALQAADGRAGDPTKQSRPDSSEASGQAGRRRALVASGPAPAEEAIGDEGDDPDPVDSRSGAARESAAAWSRRRLRSFPLFRPPRRDTHPLTGATARRRARPLLLSKLLGRGALRPPPAALVPPDFSSLKGRRPLLMPDGSPVPTRPYELDRIEGQDPRTALAACRRRARHWDAGLLWHDGAARGVIADARWLWLWKESTRWWAVREPEQAALLRHQGRWWSKQRGVWFALHDGQLWSWRRFSDWDAEGLIRLTDGVELVYSADFTKVAVITPGAGAVLYDAYTGAELGEWLESELPRRRPRPPGGLRLPRGI